MLLHLLQLSMLDEPFDIGGGGGNLYLVDIIPLQRE